LAGEVGLQDATAFLRAGYRNNFQDADRFLQAGGGNLIGIRAPKPCATT